MPIEWGPDSLETHIVTDFAQRLRSFWTQALLIPLFPILPTGRVHVVARRLPHAPGAGVRDLLKG